MLTIKVNEDLFAKACTLGLNEAAGCLDFAINFPSIATIVDVLMKRITELPFIFYTHAKSYFQIPEEFIKFEATTYTYRYHLLTSQGSMARYAARRPNIDFQHYPLFCIKQSHPQV